MFHVDTGADCQQLLRHLGEHPASVPVWRRQRPALMIEAASYRPATTEEQVRGGGGTSVWVHLLCNAFWPSATLLAPNCRSYQPPLSLHLPLSRDLPRQAAAPRAPFSSPATCAAPVSPPTSCFTSREQGTSRSSASRRRRQGRDRVPGLRQQQPGRPALVHPIAVVAEGRRRTWIWIPPGVHLHCSPRCALI